MTIRSFMAPAVAGLMALALGPLSLQAQDNDINADGDLIRQVTVANLQEIQLGRLAQQKAANSAVRQFGDRMVADHQSLHNQWSALGDGKFKPTLGQFNVGEVRQLEKLSGAEFDRAYMTSMIRHHERSVSLFQNQAQSARSVQVRDLVARGLPILQQHLRLARQIGGQVGVDPAIAVAGPGDPSEVPADRPVITQTPQAPSQPQRAPGRTQPAPSENRRVTNEDLKKDSRFIREVVQDNTLEIRRAQAAESRASDPAVKRLAREVARDHATMQEQWIAMASRNGMSLRPGMGPKHRDKAERLEKVSGRELDRFYLNKLIRDYKDYIDYFEKEGRAARSAQVRQLVDRHTPILKRHFTQAKRVGAQVGADTAATLRSERKTARR